jgi:hypothetical protein
MISSAQLYADVETVHELPWCAATTGRGSPNLEKRRSYPNLFRALVADHHSGHLICAIEGILPNLAAHVPIFGVLRGSLRRLRV